MTLGFIRRHAGVLAILLCLFLIALALSLLRHPLALDDGLRHFAMARLMAERGIGSISGWGVFFSRPIYQTLNCDPWFLSDVLLIPFTVLPIGPALKVFTLVSVAAVLGSLLLILKHLRLPHLLTVLAILLLAFGNQDFTFRMLIARPFTLMTALILVLYWSILARKPLITTGLIALSFLLSHLFVFPIAICALAILLGLLMGKKREAVHLALAVLCGLLIGLLLHPHAIIYLQYLFTVFFRIPFLVHTLSLGNELRPAGLASAAVGTVVLLVFLLHILLMRRGVTMEVFLRKNIVLADLIVIGLFGVYLSWMRGIDLLWPMILILLAQLSSLAPDELLFTISRRLKPWIGALLITYVLLSNATIMIDRWQSDAKRDLSPFAADLANIPTGASVLNTDWDLLPIYLAVRPDLRYAIGMDPAWTYLDNERASALVQMMHSTTFERADPVIDATKWLDQLLREYPADYLVISKKRYPNFSRQLASVERLRERTESGSTLAVFLIK